MKRRKGHAHSMRNVGRPALVPAHIFPTHRNSTAATAAWTSKMSAASEYELYMTAHCRGKRPGEA